MYVIECHYYDYQKILEFSFLYILAMDPVLMTKSAGVVLPTAALALCVVGIAAS